jgi:CRP-like cAMP-binding protein
MKAEDSEILRRSSVFRFLSNEHFETIESLLQEEQYDFGDVIAKQGDLADSFYVLTRGRACALKIKAVQAIERHALVHNRGSVAGRNARRSRSGLVALAGLPAITATTVAEGSRRRDWQAGTAA